MTFDARLIDRLRGGLFSLPIPVFTLLAFVVFALLMLIVGLATTAWDPGIELSRQGSLVFAAIFGAIMTVGSAVGELSRRKKFVDAGDRAAYHRAIDLEVLPLDGVPMHWREQMLTEIADRSRAQFGAIAIAVALGLVIAAMIARGGEWPLIVLAVALYAALVIALLMQIKRSRRAERLYVASSPRMEEGAR